MCHTRRTASGCPTCPVSRTAPRTPPGDRARTGTELILRAACPSPAVTAPRGPGLLGLASRRASGARRAGGRPPQPGRCRGRRGPGRARGHARTGRRPAPGGRPPWRAGAAAGGPTDAGGQRDGEDVDVDGRCLARARGGGDLVRPAAVAQYGVEQPFLPSKRRVAVVDGGEELREIRPLDAHDRFPSDNAPGRRTLPTGVPSGMSYGTSRPPPR